MEVFSGAGNWRNDARKAIWVAAAVDSQRGDDGRIRCEGQVRPVARHMSHAVAVEVAADVFRIYPLGNRCEQPTVLSLWNRVGTSVRG